MLRKRLVSQSSIPILLLDSITGIEPNDAGAVVISASHGGRSSGEVAATVETLAVFFNDAGIGKEEAGVAALEMLAQKGCVAGTVSYMSARIGDAEDAWQNGIISRLNTPATNWGLWVGKSLRSQILDRLNGK